MKRFYICVALCAILLLPLAATADTGWKDISVWYGVTVTINGTPLAPTDANGKAAPALIYDGTVYLPARAIAEALGNTVAWDAEHKVADITYETQPPETAAPETTPSKYAFPFVLVSNDGENRFLGKLVTSKEDPDGIWNPIGTYGSDKNEYSIWNFFSIYGAGAGDYSMRSHIATHPPRIIDSNGIVYGYMTVNYSIYNPYTDSSLYQFLKDNGQ